MELGFADIVSVVSADNLAAGFTLSIQEYLNRAKKSRRKFELGGDSPKLSELVTYR
jgi:hypothetical protein